MLNKLFELHSLVNNMCRTPEVVWSPASIFNNSSHLNHVVIILNRPIAVNFKREFVWKLWRAASLRLTVDGGTDQWLSWLKLNKYESCDGSEPDLITGDMDSVSTEAVNYFNNKSKNVSVLVTPDQDETDFTKSLRIMHCHALSKAIQYNAVIVFAETSGRFDQILANINTMYKAKEIIPHADVMLVSSNSLTWILHEGVIHKINIPKKLLDKKEWCALIPVGRPCVVTSTGLKWNLSNSVLEFGNLVSSSNTYNGESAITIKTNNPLVWSMGIESLL